MTKIPHIIFSKTRAIKVDTEITNWTFHTIF